MATRIRYMGNKHDVAPTVAALVAEQPHSVPLVDAFCGMCSIGGSIAPSSRQVICNDVQSFAALVARCLIATRPGPPAVKTARAAMAGAYAYNRRLLVERFSDELAEEDEILEAADAAAYRRAYQDWRHAGNDDNLAEEVAAAGIATPYRLATLSFAWGYFGLRQSIAIDSIRYAIDRARATGAMSGPQADWALVALLQAASCAAASPGHFAQYLRANGDQGFIRVLRQRRRNLWTQFLEELHLLRPYGLGDWREENTVVQSDALSVFSELDRLDLKRAIVYADPPYSKDHYSRYYHVLETLVLYDYPSLEGKGRYRPDRFVTPFSLKGGVQQAMSEFCASIQERGFTLILSYPSNGLLNGECGIDLTEFLAEHFDDVDLQMRKPTTHSTLGARHGTARNAVEELLWVAR